MTDTINPSPPDPEVPARARRRRFSAQEKLRILSEADLCKESGGIGALLRREGIYYSQLATWRKVRAASGAAGLHNKKPGREKLSNTLHAQRIHELEKKNRKLEKKLRQAELIIEIQKKVAAMMDEIKRKYANPGSEN